MLIAEQAFPVTIFSANTDDDALVARLQARDKRAMEDLLRLHGAKLYGVALQVTRSETEAQEALQDALVNIWTKIEKFEGRSALTSWMYRVTANAALMKLRKNKKFQQHVPLENYGGDRDLPVVQLADTAAGPRRQLDNRELGERVQAAIDALPEPYRTTVILSDIEELSMEEVAEATDVSVPAAKSRLHRGRLALRKVLTPYLKESR